MRTLDGELEIAKSRLPAEIVKLLQVEIIFQNSFLFLFFVGDVVFRMADARFSKSKPPLRRKDAIQLAEERMRIREVMQCIENYHEIEFGIGAGDVLAIERKEIAASARFAVMQFLVCICFCQLHGVL